MKTLFTLLLAFLCLVAQSQLPGIPAALQNKSLSQTSVSTNHPGTEKWYDNARQYIRQHEYHIDWNKDLQQYVAVNRNNHLAFYFANNGYRALSFTMTGNTDNNWEYSFLLNDIQRDNRKLSMDFPATIQQNGETLKYDYPQYSIEYLNDVNGMRQDFVVKEKPAGCGNLEIAIALQGDLQPAIDDQTKLVLSGSKEKGQVKLSYDQLKVWDNNHRSLDAHMELKDNGKTLVISVNDENAVYPVTIDPLNHTPNWTDNGQGVLPSLDVLYGSSISDAGDINNDGYDDIIIGAPANIDILSGTIVASVGQAFIYLGSSTGPSAVPDITLQSSTTINGLFGYSVSSAGDINNDGYDDVIVGAPGDQVTLNFGFPFGTQSHNIGKVYVYYGNSNPASIPGSVININLTTSDFSGATFGLTVNPLFGFSVSGAGDVNNDGYDDVIVGSPVYTDLGSLTIAGRATIYLGGSGGLNTASPIHRNGALLANTLFGFSVSSAGDMNNDGADEVLIGAPGALSLLPGLTGVAYVYPGIPAPAPGGIAASPVTYSDGALLKTLFGFSVSNAGDVNNDGYDDIVVGEPATLDLTGLVTVGKASVFYGSATLTNKTSADVTLRSPRDPDILGLAQGNLLFGYSVSGGRDLDCDGIDDVIVGEPGGTALTGLAGVNAVSGEAYIYYGQNGNGPHPYRGWELKETGTLTVANLLGSSVSMAGDVNGDGSQDIFVGASNGTLDLSNLLGGLLNFVFVQSVGSAYINFGCITPSLFTLPVQLTWFRGNLESNTVVLKWQTASEQNLSHFDIERSVNGSAFEKIGQVAAKGESTTTSDYNFTDMHPVHGTNTYRLKIADKDGKSSYSSLINIKLENSSAIHIRSTVVSSSFTIDFTNASAGLYTIDLVGMNGQVMQTKKVNIASPVATEQVSIKDGMATGMYMVRILNTGTSALYQEKIFIR